MNKKDIKKDSITTRKFYHASGLILSDTQYYCGEEYVLLNNTNRYHKVYYNGSYRKDCNPYIVVNNKRYSLSEFISDIV